jgi:hypothetical protein
MKLQQALQDPEAWMYLERYVNDGSRTYSPFSESSEVEQQYQPTAAFQSFELPSLMVPKDMLMTRCSTLADASFARHLEGDLLPFYIHPQLYVSDDQSIVALKKEFAAGDPIVVSPTASTRTVFVRASAAAPAHFLKLHLPRRISRMYRWQMETNIKGGISVSSDLAHVAYERFAYLPDTVGVALTRPGYGWGYTIREARPAPHCTESRPLIPYFALYAQDMYHPDDPPLLVQLIEQLHGDPKQFILEEIVLPLVRGWCITVRDRGILLAAHGQNALLETALDGKPQRVVHRDLDKKIDSRIRARNNLPALESTNILGDDAMQKYSIVYDLQIGHHLLDYLAALGEKFYGIPARDLHGETQEAFRTYLPEHDELFPKTMFAYEHTLVADNKPRCIDTGETPHWR